MPLTPEDVRSRRFKTSFRGYDETEVDTFLDEVEVELTRLLGDAETMRQRLETAQSMPPPQPVHSEAEEMLRRTLLLAQRTADETVASAQAEAERLTSEARALADAVRLQAEQQKAAAISDLERRRQALEQHIDGLRAFEREYRTRLKAYLESQLHDLDGRGQPPGDVPAAPAPAPAPVEAEPAVAPAVADVTPTSYGDGAPEPFDIDEGEGEIPRLAP
jgi:DivIVA domain-containing protein